MAMRIIVATRTDIMPAAAEHDFNRLLTEAFRRASWRVSQPRPEKGLQPDLIVEGRGSKYVVEVKRSSEGRRDRVIPLLSQAILEAEAHARQFPDGAIPVAVVGAEHIAPTMVDSVHSFIARVAPQAAV